MPPMRWLRHTPPKTLIFWGLIVLSAVSLALPAGWSDGLKSLTQLLVPPQDWLHRTARRTADGLHEWAQSAGGEDARAQSAAAATDLDHAAMENQILALTGQLEEIRRENSSLRGLRERYLPPGVRLVSAHVVARDVAAWRDTLLLSRGANQAVQRSDPVTTRLFVGTGTRDGVAIGHLVVAREILIGQVEQVSPYSSRVQLFSDIGVRTPVRIGRVAAGRTQWVDYPCTLLGRGRGEMVIADVPLRYIDDEAASGDESSGGTRSRGSASPDRMRPGDLVVSPPRPPELPTPMAIGRIESFEHDARKRLVATVHVKGLIAEEDIREVFVVASGERE